MKKVISICAIALTLLALFHFWIKPVKKESELRDCIQSINDNYQKDWEYLCSLDDENRNEDGKCRTLNVGTLGIQSLNSIRKEDVEMCIKRFK